MSSLFHSPKRPRVPSQKIEDVAAERAAKLEAERLRKRKGALSTILTGSQGITSPAQTYKTTLG